MSGGQKQRTAIARAIVREPRILILDDALSSVDTYTEEKILSRLRGIMRERTSIIVSHRVSTVRDADLICVLDEGRIVERGTHDELLTLGQCHLNEWFARINLRQGITEERASISILLFAVSIAVAGRVGGRNELGPSIFGF